MRLEFKNEKALLSQVKQAMLPFDISQPVAVFDADGTLWPEDANDLFLDYQHRLKIRDFSDLFNENYKGLRSQRCQEFASRQAGLDLKDFKKQLDSFLEQQFLQVFSFQKEILSFLKSKGVFIYVVTASMKLLVEAAILKYQLPVDKVLGMHPQIQNGKLTSKIILPLTYGEGKREALLEHIKPEQILLASGNSTSDLSFLKMAKVPFVVNAAQNDSIVYLSERETATHARKNNWIVFESK